MKAMILAAGFGNRMKPLSDRLPKPLLPILGRPLIACIIAHLKTVSIKTIGVNIHHLADKMQTYLENGSPWGVETIISREKAILETGGGMRAMRAFFPGKDLFLVYNGDVLSEINLPELIEQHFHRGPLVTMALCDFPPKNNVTFSRDGTIVDFSGKGGAFQSGGCSNLTFTGISVVDSSVLDLIPREGASNIIDVYRELIERKPGSIHGYVTQGKYWIDIGTPVSYLQAHRDILIGGNLATIFNKIHGNRIYKGPGSVIESGTSLEGFVSLGKNCLVRENAFLKNCVVWDNTVVEKEDRLENGVKNGDWRYRILC